MILPVPAVSGQLPRPLSQGPPAAPAPRSPAVEPVLADVALDHEPAHIVRLPADTVDGSRSGHL